MLIAALLLLGLGGMGGFLLAWSGVYNVGAATGHWAITRWLLEFGMRNAVETHALGIAAPRLEDDPLFYRGLGHYAGACAPCHGAPGQPRNRVVRAMLPEPPHLSDRVPHWEPEELFWIVKNGLKYTGMPSWPAQRRDDEVWAVVAFLLQMPTLDPLEYRRLALDTAARGDATAKDSIRPLSAFGPVSEQLVNCARCHGADGGGGGAGGFPRLAGQKTEYLYNALRSYAAGARPSGVMEPIAAELNDREMRQLAARYAGVTDVPWQEDGSPADAQLLQRGAEIVRAGIPDQGVPACSACHGALGRGRDKHPAYPALAGQFAEYLELQLALWREGERGGGPFAEIMHVIGRRLEPGQARDVALYLASIRPAPPAVGAGGE